MNARDLRQVLLVRAFEDPVRPPWSEADRRWADEAGARAAGAESGAEVHVVQRARVAHHRLAARIPPLRGLEAALRWPASLAPVLAAVAFGFGVATNAVAPGNVINLLAPPLALLLAWNLAVYLMLALSVLQPLGGLGSGLRSLAIGGLRTGVAAALRGLEAQWREPLARFVADWSRATRPLALARIASALHVAAAAFAFGALASLYLRGIAFEYRAGWESTFLTATAVQRLLSIVLTPASALTGIAVPDAEALAAMRLPAGGVNAASWIHLYAVTLLLFVVLPRLVLAGIATRRDARLRRAMPLDLAEPYYERLLRGRSQEPVTVQVIPYSYQVPAAVVPGIGPALQGDFGDRLAVQLAPTVALGDEDAAAPAPGVAGPVVALFPLTATPEREHHGLFVDMLGARCPGRVSVLIDESGFRQRFPGEQGAARLAQRRAAWQRLLQEHGQQPRFADLSGGLL